MDKARRALQISILLIATVFFASTAYAACTVSSCHWSKTGTYTEGTVVEMHATFSSGCSGTAYYYIYEDDTAGDDDIATKSASVGSVAKWTTSWVDDISGDPEYYFEVYVGGSYKCASSSNLYIKQKVCTPCEKYCSGSTLYTCNSDGSAWTTTSCSSYGCDSASASCKICSAGSKKCDGDYLLTCNSAGTSWDGFSCTYGCSSGACKPRPMVCIPSTYFCDGSVRRKCSSDGYSSSKIETCSNGCDSSSAKCNKICTPGSMKCEGSGVGSTEYECSSDGYSWEGTTCLYGCDSSSGCKAPVCTAGTNACDGNILKTCKSDRTGWDSTTCTYGCTSGACNPQPCTATNCRWSASESVEEGTNVNMYADFSGECSGKTLNFDIYEDDDTSGDDDAGSQSVTYGNTASWTTSWTEDCWGCGDPEYYFELYIGSSYQCDSADLGVSKKQPICTPGEKQCDGNVYKTCTSDGYDWEGTTCLYGCDSSIGCKPFCTPDAKRCNGNVIEQCNSQGSSWTTVETCSNGCDVLTPVCKPICSPFVSQCDGDTLKTCDPSGYSYTTRTCQYGCDSSTSTCSKLCTPDSKQCDGNVLKTCASDGYSWEGTTCVRGCDSTTLDCRPAVCSVTSATWSTSIATQDDTVTLSANTENCNGKDIVFEIWEDDWASNDDRESYVSASIANNIATATWNAAFQSDCIFNICRRPEYYFKVLVNEVPTGPNSSTMEVRPISGWQYLDAAWACIGPGDYSSWGDEITCNVAPVIELIPDIRDSLACVKNFPSTVKNLAGGECMRCFVNTIPFTDFISQAKCMLSCDESAGVNLAICGITLFAFYYDVASYAADIGTAFAATPVAEAGDVAISTLKTALKALGEKAAKDVVTTLLAVPKLIKWTGRTVGRFARDTVARGTESLLVALGKTGGDEAVAKIVQDIVDNLPNSKLTAEALDNIGEFAGLAKRLGASLDFSKLSRHLPEFHELITSGKLADKLKAAESAGFLKASFPMEISFVDELYDGKGNVARGLTEIIDKSTGKALILPDFAANKNIPVAIKVTLPLTNDFGADSVKVMKDSTLFHEFAHAWQADKILKDIDKVVVNGKVVITEEYFEVFDEFFAEYAPYKLLTGTDLDEFLTSAKAKSLKDYDVWMNTVNNPADLDANWLKTEKVYAKAKAFGMTDIVSGMDARLVDIARNSPSAENLIRIMKDEKIPMFIADAQKFVDNLAYDELTQDMINILKRPPTEWIPSGGILDIPTQNNDPPNSDSTSGTTGSTGTTGGGQTDGTQTTGSTSQPDPTGTTGGGQTASNQTSNSTGTTGAIDGGQTGGTQPSCPPNTICGGEIGGDEIGGGQIGGGQTPVISEPVCTTENVCKIVRSCHTKRYGFLNLFRKRVCNNVQVCTPQQVCK